MDSETTTDLPHKCDQCSRSFKTANALLAHSRFHKPEKTAWVAPEPGPTPRFDWVPANEILNQAAQHTGAAPALTNVTTMTVTTPSLSVVRIQRLPHYDGLPAIVKATPGSAAYDLHAAIDTMICIGAGERSLVPTGLKIELPVNFVAKVVPRSGLALNNGITLLNSPGIIDSDYRGEIKLIVINHSRTKFWVQPGMRLAQMMIEVHPVISVQFVDELSETSRGLGGFGSTGTTKTKEEN